MNAIVGEDILIRNVTPEARRYFERELTFDNPEYYKRRNTGRWTGNTPSKISLSERRGDDLVIPFGMLPVVFRNKKYFESIDSKFTPAVKSIDFRSAISPTDYQERAIAAAVQARQGVVVAPCGAGKTMIGLEIASRIGRKTLWLTHTTDLLNQSMDRAKSFLGLSHEDYGTITAGKVNIGRAVTFATVQTMNKLDLHRIRDEFDVVIVDEAHHVVGSPIRVMMFYRVISSLRARYKFGLTATPERADGLTPCMYALIGPEVCRISTEDVGGITCPVKVNVRKTNYSPDLDRITLPDGTISYPQLVNDIVGNDDRNSIIVEDIKNADGTCLVLTDRIIHAQFLRDELRNEGVAAESISGFSQAKSARSEREQVFEDLRSGKIKVLIATYALAKEGLDVPTLRNLFLATPQKTESIVTQAAGRVSRSAAGKEFGVIYDYVDSWGMLIGWQRKRNGVYRKLGYEIN